MFINILYLSTIQSSIKFDYTTYDFQVLSLAIHSSSNKSSANPFYFPLRIELQFLKSTHPTHSCHRTIWRLYRLHYFINYIARGVVV